MNTIITITSLTVGILIGWCIACIKIKKSAVNMIHKLIKNYIYRCDIDGVEHQFKFDEIFNEHLFDNNVDKGWNRIIQLVEDNRINC